jgi:hypothetical protein
VVESVPTVELAAAFSLMLVGDSAMSVGTSFTSLTVIVNCFEKVPPLPSSVWMRTDRVPPASKFSGVFTSRVDPLIWNEPLSVSPVPLTRE